jgi:hypothetical protein
MKEKTDKNYHSGDKIDDLVDAVKKAEHKKQEGVTQKDSNYEAEMYSDDQLEKHKKMDNIFKVDGVPSRWEHNKTRSTFHFDPFGDSTEQTFIITNRFVGDFEPAVKYAIANAKEQTIGNYRPRNLSKQDKDDVHQARLHIQKLGQVTPAHIDQQMRYARPGWRKVWTEAGADKNPLMLRRFLVMLQDWDYGHVWQFGNTYYSGYRAGECVTYDWCNMPHGTANFGYTPRVTFQFTGFISEKTQEFINNPDPNRIIEV